MGINIEIGEIVELFDVFFFCSVVLFGNGKGLMEGGDR